jgi:heat shock protein HtpX
VSSIDRSRWFRHRWINRLQTIWLMLALLSICALAGWLIFGEMGLGVALATGLAALLIEPAASSRLTLRLYRARPIRPQDAPDLWRFVRELAVRAGLHDVPLLYYVPSRVVNAFAIGSRQHAAIAVTDGLMQTLSPRELAGVLAHEVAHIAHGDLRVMSLADSISRLTILLALLGQVLLVLALPAMLLGAAEVNVWGLLLLALAPHLALLAQMGLSRVREFDADQAAAALTGDPEGLAHALSKIERLTRSWRFFLQPGWGNSEASWLRTHPATADRIARLMTLTPSRQPVIPLSPSPLNSVAFRNLPLRAPRLHLWGHWR